MRKMLAAGLAAVISVGAIAATSTGAAAHSAPYPTYGAYGPYGPWGYGAPTPLAYAWIGTPFFGVGVRTPYFGWHHRAWRAHVAWCSARYRSYNPATDTYFKRRGVAAQCVSPTVW